MGTPFLFYLDFYNLFGHAAGLFAGSITTKTGPRTLMVVAD